MQVIACTSCPAGHECPDNDAPPVVCASGTYSTGGSASCDSCPAGSQCQDPAASPTSCDTGYWSADVSVSFQCPYMYVSIVNVSKCLFNRIAVNVFCIFV